MKNIQSLIFLLLVLFIFSCDKNSIDFTCCDFEISYENDYDLIGSWSLVGIVQKNPLREECADGGWVIFNDDGTIGGSSSCNQLLGKYKLNSSNGIVIESLVQTLRGCVGNESIYWEKKFPSELREAEKYKIDGNKMIIYTLSGNQLVFIAF